VRRLLILLGLLAALLFAASLVLPLAPLAQAAARSRELARLILIELRLPRAVLALAIGGFLGLSGAAMQGLLRNPLASPDVTGASAGAALGAVGMVYFALAAPFAVAIGAVGGAGVALALLLGLAWRGATTERLILAGVAIATLAGALTTLALSLAPSPYALYDALTWLMGSLADRSLAHVAVAVPLMAFGALLILPTARGLDALSLGEDVAASLGWDAARLRLRIVAGTALGLGGAVAAAGSIGFVGLVAPHLVRPLVGHRPGAALWPSALAGAGLLLAADLLVRLPIGNGELRLGVVTALIGTPFLIRLLLKGGR
jgi:iron complex transport system permease protein